MAVVPVVFHHADANVMAQVQPALSQLERAQLFGPASMLIFAPDRAWSGGAAVVQVSHPSASPLQVTTTLSLSMATVARIGGARIAAWKFILAEEFGGAEGSSKRRTQVERAVDRADRYGFDTLEEFRGFVALDLAYGAEFEHRAEFRAVFVVLTDHNLPPRAKMDRVVAVLPQPTWC